MKEEKEARDLFFLRISSQVCNAFLGASVKDLIDFADYLKECAFECRLNVSGVEQAIDRENYFRTKKSNVNARR